MPSVGFYGDDFTGSVDALLQFRRAGLDGVLLTDPEHLDSATDHAVVGLAGISRSLAATELAAEVTPALTLLRELNPRVVQYKACSTVDSAPEIGSIGRVIEIARQLYAPLPVPMLFAQPDFGRYTVFGQHFARDGDRVHRLDRHPTMAHHPVTPITEADLSRLIGRQTWLTIDSVPWTDYQDPQHLAAMINNGSAGAVVCDAFTDDHLTAVAAAALTDPSEPRFMIGSGGLSLGLGRALRPDRTDDGDRALPTSAEPAIDRTVAISGSWSERTRAQIAAAARSGWLGLDVFEPDAVARAVEEHRAGRPVVIHSLSHEVPDGSRTREIVDRLADVATACLGLGRDTRLISCGGDTSGSVLRRIGVRELSIKAQPWGNVVLGRATQTDGRSYELILKGGQMGHRDLLEDVRQGRALSTS